MGSLSGLCEMYKSHEIYKLTSHDGHGDFTGETGDPENPRRAYVIMDVYNREPATGTPLLGRLIRKQGAVTSSGKAGSTPLPEAMKTRSCNTNMVM